MRARKIDRMYQAKEIMRKFKIPLTRNMPTLMFFFVTLSDAYSDGVQDGMDDTMSMILHRISMVDLQNGARGLEKEPN